MTELEIESSDPGFCSLICAPCQNLRALYVSYNKAIDTNVGFQMRKGSIEFLDSSWEKKSLFIYELYFFIVKFLSQLPNVF